MRLSHDFDLTLKARPPSSGDACAFRGRNTPETGGIIIGEAHRDTARSAAAATSKRRPNLLLLIAIAFSVGVHFAAIAAIWPSDEDEQFGTLADKTDAISMETTQTLVLESIVTDTNQTAAAASASSQAGSVQSAESAPQELAEVEAQPVSDEPPPKPIKVSDATPAAVTPMQEPLPVIRGGAAPDEASEIKADKQAEKLVEEMPSEVETKDDQPEKVKHEEKIKKERKTEQKQSHQQTAGSATSRASAAQVAVNGRVSASRGNALSYAARVRAQVGRNKPSGSGRRGTVRVSFGIAVNGDLSYVRLSQSSGNITLDEEALAAVRHAAPFSPPPSDVSPTQLTFLIPFYFR